MKKTLVLLVCVTAVTPVFVLSQITKSANASPSIKTAPATMSTNASTNTSINAATLAGVWNGTQTDMTGLYPQAVSFQLTNTGEFFLGTNQSGIKGSFTVSGNNITGNYKQPSSGEIFSFSATYDPASQRLTGTTGAGANVTGQGKWTVTRAVSKVETLSTPLALSTAVKKNTTTVSNPPAPPPAGAVSNPTSVTSGDGIWKGRFKYDGFDKVYDYTIEFRTSTFKITDNTKNAAWDENIVATGNYSSSGNTASGTIFFKNDESKWYSFSATISGNQLYGTFGPEGERTGMGNWQMTYVAPVTKPKEPNNVYYLLAAKVRFYTGNDNKELLSKVDARLFSFTSADRTNNLEIYYNYVSDQAKAEFRTNSISEVTLDVVGDLNYNTELVNLATINRRGMRFVVTYFPNLFTDAWKVEKIELILQFKNSDGLPHPTWGEKIIPLLNANALLTNSKNVLTFNFDGFLFQ